MACETITSEEGFLEFLKENRLAIVDFKADWCKPCKTIAPFFEKMAQKYPQLKFAIVDVDDKNTVLVSMREKVESMPTFIVYKNGIRVDHVIGANETAVEQMIQCYTD